MKFRNVERLEIVIRRFDFRTFDHGKSDGHENVFDFLKNPANQMARPEGTHDARKRKVHALITRPLFLGVLYFQVNLIELGLDV